MVYARSKEWSRGEITQLPMDSNFWFFTSHSPLLRSPTDVVRPAVHKSHTPGFPYKKHSHAPDKIVVIAFRDSADSFHICFVLFQLVGTEPVSCALEGKLSERRVVVTRNSRNCRFSSKLPFSSFSSSSELTNLPRGCSI